jgi:putative heme transporter
VRRTLKVTGGLLSLGLAGFLLIVLLPRALGVDWATTARQVASVPLADVGCLVVVWLAGLGVHSITLQRSLPGLSARRALALNLGGSSVSNLLPLGGAAGIGLNYAMLRSWGYDRVQISAFTAVSNLVVALVKALVAAGGIVALMCMPRFAEQWSGPGSTGVIVMSVTAGAVVLIAGICCHPTIRGYLRRRVGGLVVRLWRQCAHVLRSGWRGLAVGGVGYPLLQVALLWSCMVALHANVGITAVLAAYAIERTLTLIPITPGGIGVVETAAAAVLVGFGADPVKAAAGVLLFRVFSYLLEIPVGAVVVAAWFARHRRRPKVAV